MVVNQDVTGVTSLTTEQAKAIWTGATTNWKDVGGPDEPIVLILRPESPARAPSSRRSSLGGADEATGQALTEDSNGAVTQAVPRPRLARATSASPTTSRTWATDGAPLDGVDATVPK